MSEVSVARGKLFVIAAPSGAGKTTLVRALDDARAVAAVFDFLYDSQAAAQRTARPRLFLRRSRRVRAHGRCRRVPRARARVRQLLRHLEASSRKHASRWRERAARDRLAGRAADPSRHARMSVHFHPAAVARGARTSGCAAVKRTTTKSSRVACAIRSPTCHIGTSSTTSSSTTISSAPPPSSKPLSRVSGETLRRDRSELQTLLPRLLG